MILVISALNTFAKFRRNHPYSDGITPYGGVEYRFDI